ncbi:MAG: ABC transporter permease, partial [Rhodothermales bacterium]
MLRNYLLVALRNLRKYKLYASINVVGLALGLAFCTLIFLYVRDEMTYDLFHERADRIHRVYRASYNPDGSSEQNDPWLPMPLGPAMKADLPEVDEYVRLSQNRRFVRSEGEAMEEELLFADPSFFRVFSFSLRSGDPEAALADPGSVVLTEAAARKYFGDQDPVGRLLAIRLDDAFL